MMYLRWVTCTSFFFCFATFCFSQPKNNNNDNQTLDKRISLLYHNKLLIINVGERRVTPINTSNNTLQRELYIIPEGLVQSLDVKSPSQKRVEPVYEKVLSIVHSTLPNYH